MSRILQITDTYRKADRHKEKLSLRAMYVEHNSIALITWLIAGPWSTSEEGHPCTEAWAPNDSTDPCRACSRQLRRTEMLSKRKHRRSRRLDVTLLPSCQNTNQNKTPVRSHHKSAVRFMARNSIRYRIKPAKRWLLQVIEGAFCFMFLKALTRSHSLPSRRRVMSTNTICTGKELFLAPIVIW